MISAREDKAMSTKEMLGYIEEGLEEINKVSEEDLVGGAYRLKILTEMIGHRELSGDIRLVILKLAMDMSNYLSDDELKKEKVRGLLADELFYSRKM